MAGLTPTGFVKKLFTEIRDEIIAAIRSVPGLSRVNLDRDSYMGGAVVAVANSISETWDVMAELYASFDPDSASGRSLDNLCAITGVYRKPATPTLVTCTVTLAAGVYPPGVLLASKVGSPTLVFANRDQITSPGGAVAGQIFVAQDTGPIAVPATTLSVIATPFPGWSAITNPTDGVKGTNEESDAELRQRRLQGPPKSALLRDSRVKKVFIFENNTDATVGILGPHSFEAVVWDGTNTGTNISDAEIAALILQDKPAGIQTYGSLSEVVVDSVGLPHTINFSRPTVKPVWLIVQVKVGTGWDPINGPDLIKQALVDFGALRYECGVDVVHTSLFGPVYTVPGVTDSPQIFSGFAPAPIGTSNLTIAEREIAELDTSRISVVVVP